MARDGAASSTDLEMAFAAFRAAYPRMQGERGALREFIKAVSDGADPDHIVARAKVFAAECKDQASHLIMQPTNWLRNGHYDDPMPEGLVINEAGEPVAVQTNKPKRAMTSDELADEYLRRTYGNGHLH